MRTVPSVPARASAGERNTAEYPENHSIPRASPAAAMRTGLRYRRRTKRVAAAPAASRAMTAAIRQSPGRRYRQSSAPRAKGRENRSSFLMASI